MPSYQSWTHYDINIKILVDLKTVGLERDDLKEMIKTLGQLSEHSELTIKISSVPCSTSFWINRLMESPYTCTKIKQQSLIPLSHATRMCPASANEHLKKSSPQPIAASKRVDRLNYCTALLPRLQCNDSLPFLLLNSGHFLTRANPRQEWPVCPANPPHCWSNSTTGGTSHHTPWRGGAENRLQMCPYL